MKGALVLSLVATVSAQCTLNDDDDVWSNSSQTNATSVNCRVGTQRDALVTFGVTFLIGLIPSYILAGYTLCRRVARLGAKADTAGGASRNFDRRARRPSRCGCASASRSFRWASSSRASMSVVVTSRVLGLDLAPVVGENTYYFAFFAPSVSCCVLALYPTDTCAVRSFGHCHVHVRVRRVDQSDRHSLLHGRRPGRHPSLESYSS